MTTRDASRLGCAVLIGAVVAFPAGMMFAGRDRAPEEQRPAPAGKAGRAAVRNVYSPNVTSDPYVLDQQRKVVEALELQCRQAGERCAEAAQARQWIDKQD